MNIIDVLADIAIILVIIYCVATGYVSIKDWIWKNRRG